jgi:hypothetical protein
MSNSTNQQADESFITCNHVVAFVDILGQKSELSRFTTMPLIENEEQNDEFIAWVAETVGKVRSLRSTVEKNYNIFGDTNMRGSRNIPEQIRDQYNSLLTIPVGFKRFSDGMAFYISLQKHGERVYLNGVLSILASCSITLLEMLSSRIPIRGGIELGIGTEVDNDGLYGPAVAGAYCLESEVALYPRIVVGEELVRYLNSVEQWASGDLPDNIQDKGVYLSLSNSLANICKELIMIDCDGYPVVDMFSDFSLRSGNRPMLLALSEKALDFAQSQAAEFARKKNTKLTIRYQWLTQILNDGIEKIQSKARQ